MRCHVAVVALAAVQSNGGLRGGALCRSPVVQGNENLLYYELYYSGFHGFAWRAMLLRMLVYSGCPRLAAAQLTAMQRRASGTPVVICREVLACYYVLVAVDVW